jgi:hypothetical protein
MSTHENLHILSWNQQVIPDFHDIIFTTCNVLHSHTFRAMNLPLVDQLTVPVHFRVQPEQVPFTLNDLLPAFNLDLMGEGCEVNHYVFPMMTEHRAQHLLAPRSGATTILGAVGWNFGCLCHPQRLEVHLLPQRSSRLCPATPKPAALRSCTSRLTVWDGSSRPWEVTSAGDDLGLTLRADLQPTPNDPWPLELQDQHPSLQFLSILWELNQRYTLW